MKTKTINLEKVRIGVMTRVLDVWGQNCEITEVEDFLTNNLAVSLRSFCWCDEEREVVAAEWPADWWQAVKERFAPSWFLRRWPVKTKRASMTARVAYTKLPYHFPEEKSIVQFVRHEHDGEEDE
jgi:hypothetical protein